MLRITMSKSASGAKKYYCEQYYKEGQSAQLHYYTGEEQRIGRWGGKAASMLGLKGDINKQDFARLCDNIHPLTHKTLTGRNDTDRTVGYDFTFNASKSVSIAYALGDDTGKRLILDAFQQAVHAAMSEIEAGMQARVRARGKNENRLTGNVAYGAFTHFTTRPIDGVADPHLHSHCFVFNATYDDREKKWKAGQFRQIKQDAPYYEAVFHSSLAHYLQQAGYGIRQTKNGFELVGIHKETIDKFSRRTQEIEDYTREHGITDEQQKSQVGARTREAKRLQIAAIKQEQEWRSRLTPDESPALHHLRSPVVMREGSQSAKEAIQYSLRHHLERKSVISDKEALATAIKSAIGRATPQQIRQTFDQDATILAASEHLRTFITTRAALKEEKQLIAYCHQARNKFRPVHEHYEPQNPMLNDQQRAAVRHALSSTDGITLITGKAGTGKTTLMQEVKQGILASGKQIFSFAPSSEASRGVQRSEGFENADTVARLIQDSSRHVALKNQVIWIDEAGMLSNRDMNNILSIANAQSARVILSGDTRQHSSVERGDALRIIQQETGIRPVTVSKILRQKNADYKEAVQWLSDGKAERGFRQLDRIGAIHELTDTADRIQAIATDYYRSAHGSTSGNSKQVLVIAPTHAEGALVTRQIRHALKMHGLLNQEDHAYQTLSNRQLTEAEKQTALSYRQGDVLTFHQNSKGIRAGSRLTVTDVGSEGVLVQGREGSPFLVPFAHARKFSVFEPGVIPLASGDKISITANGRSAEGRHLFNGSSFSITEVNDDGSLRLSNGATLPADFGHIRHGYVSTSHASQGKTADKVIISQSSATFRAASLEQFYVSVSRGKEAVSIYTDDKEQLRQVVGQSSQRTSATELMEQRQQQQEERARATWFRKWQERATEAYDHFKSKYRNDGLSPTVRTEQEQAR